MTKTLTALGLLLLAGAAQAHGVYLAERADVPTIVYGESGTDDAYAPAAVTEVWAFDAAGAALDAAKVEGAANVALDVEGEAATLAAAFDHGFWTETPGGEWVNEAPEAVEGWASSARYLVWAKALAGDPAAGFAAEPAGLPLEIVPLVDPRTLVPGAELPVRVLLDGAPLAGVEVTQDFLSSPAVSAPTDAEGRTTVTVQSAGLNVLSAYHEAPYEGQPEGVLLGREATLSFAAAFPEE